MRITALFRSSRATLPTSQARRHRNRRLRHEALAERLALAADLALLASDGPDTSIFDLECVDDSPTESAPSDGEAWTLNDGAADDAGPIDASSVDAVMADDAMSIALDTVDPLAGQGDVTLADAAIPEPDYSWDGPMIDLLSHTYGDAGVGDADADDFDDAGAGDALVAAVMFPPSGVMLPEDYSLEYMTPPAAADPGPGSDLDDVGGDEVELPEITDFYASESLGDVWTFSGQVVYSGDMSDLRIDFLGVLTGQSTTVDAAGRFSILASLATTRGDYAYAKAISVSTSIESEWAATPIIS